MKAKTTKERTGQTWGQVKRSAQEGLVLEWCFSRLQTNIAALLTIWNTLLVLSALMKMLFNIPLERNLQLWGKIQPQTSQILPYERTKQLNVAAFASWIFCCLKLRVMLRNSGSDKLQDLLNFAHHHSCFDSFISRNLTCSVFKVEHNRWMWRNSASTTSH